MDCDDCNQGIEGTYYEVNGGKPVCKKCYEKNHQKSCSACSNKIEGKYYTVSGDIICDKCYKKKHGDKDGSVKCQACGTDVKGQIIRAVGFAFCPGCFICSVCKEDLTSNKQFTTDKENSLYCQKCYNEKFAPRCCKCNQPIAPKEGETTAQRLTAFDKDWHPDCFKCEDCDEVLNSKEGKSCYPIETTPLCFDCCTKRQG